MHGSAVRALNLLSGKGDSLLVAIQNIAEFWNTATRPAANNGLGFTLEETQVALAEVEVLVEVVSEDLASYAEWKALVKMHRVQGAKVHDARLAALMKTHEIPLILTFNIADFARFSGVEALHPDLV